jgi:hypothetical protein
MRPYFLVEYRYNDRKKKMGVGIEHATTADDARAYVLRTIPGAEVLFVMDPGPAFWVGSLLMLAGFCLTIRGLAPLVPHSPINWFLIAVGVASFVTGIYLQRKFD